MTTGTTTQRALLPDLIRAWAIIGIVLVNVGLFAYPAELGYTAASSNTVGDRVANGLVNGLFLAKSYALFSLMFGAGLAFQIDKAARQNADFGPRYARRLIGLFVLGLIHFIFFFIGDILMLYAVLGTLLLAFKNWSVKALVRIGVGFLVASLIILCGLGGIMWLSETYAPDLIPTTELLMKKAAPFMAALQEGSFLDAAEARALVLPEIVIGGLISQGVSVLGYFCLGLAAVKSGVILDPHAVIWRRARHVFLPLGLLGNGLAAWMLDQTMQTNPGSLLTSEIMFCQIALFMAAPFSALGYAGLIAKFASGGDGPVKRFLARGGSATLSAYLGQSVILSLVFSGYGLGYYMELGAAKCTAIALGTGAFSLVAVSLWRKVFRYGPMEVLLRRFTYLESSKVPQ